MTLFQGYLASNDVKGTVSWKGWEEESRYWLDMRLEGARESTKNLSKLVPYTFMITGEKVWV